MNNNDDHKLLAEIENKLNKAKIKHQKSDNKDVDNKKLPSAMDICAEFIGPIILGVWLGSYIDNRFNTAPYWLLILFLLGVITGGFAIYRRSKKF